MSSAMSGSRCSLLLFAFPSAKVSMSASRKELEAARMPKPGISLEAS